MNLFFTGNPFRKKNFLCKASQNLFFPAEGSAKFFSQRTASKFFFPGDCLSEFIFSWRVPLRIYFFLDFLRVHPQIINGCSLKSPGYFQARTILYGKNINETGTRKTVVTSIHVLYITGLHIDLGMMSIVLLFDM